MAAMSSPGFAAPSRGADISLKSKSGATLQARLDGDHIKGTVEIKNDTLKFEINEAKKPAGLLPGTRFQDDDRLDRA